VQIIYPTRPISVAVVMLQAECNMTCSFCVTEDALQPFGFDDALALLDGLRERGVGSVVFGGGEPFAWGGDVIALAIEAKARGLTVQIGTNGVAVPEGFAELDCVDRWVLPLVSADSASHDAMRHHRQGHHRLLLKRLEALSRAARPVTVSTVLTAVNLAGLPELGRYLGDYHAVSGNVHAWHLYRFLPLGRGGSRHRAELSISSEQYACAFRQLTTLELPFKVFRRSDMYRSQTVEFFWVEKGQIRSGSETLHEGSLRDGRPRGGAEPQS